MNGMCEWNPSKKDVTYLVRACREGSLKPESMTQDMLSKIVPSLVRCSSVTLKGCDSRPLARGSSVGPVSTEYDSTGP